MKRRSKKNHVVLFCMLFWTVIIAIFVSNMATETIGLAKAEMEGEGTAVARQYIENALPVISRGVKRDHLEESQSDVSGVMVTSTEEGKLTSSFMGMVENIFPILGTQLDDKTGKQIMGEAEDTDENRLKNESPVSSENEQKPPTDVSEPKKEEVTPVIDTQEQKKPLVLIYHTHATESYQPVTVGNFHSIEESGTVREVGNELTKALEAKGIPVLHDKTLHDNPSYSQSYGRSLATVQNHLKKNPSIKIVIDLHRDAASYSGNVGKTTNINGNKVATYSLVIGKGNGNVDKLRLFANRINAQADQLYPGLADRIIEKEYRFNQYVSDQHILLEVGNNENTIDQVKLTGKYFADLIEAYIKENPQ